MDDSVQENIECFSHFRRIARYLSCLPVLSFLQAVIHPTAEKDLGRYFKERRKFNLFSAVTGTVISVVAYEEIQDRNSIFPCSTDHNI